MKTFPNINLVIAHKLEAEKLLDYFSLRLVESDRYQIYRNASGMQVVISGMGYENARAATEYLGNLDSQSIELRGWLNVGIAGHQTAEIGSCFVANKIVYPRHGRYCFPAVIFSNIPTIEVMTVDEPELEYPQDIAYEMEAAGFWDAAIKYSSLEFVQCMKIISDNKIQSIKKITNNQVLSIISERLDLIEQCCSYMQKLVRDFNTLNQVDVIVTDLFEEYRFTVAQKYQLKRLNRRFRALRRRASFEKIVSNKFNSAKELIEKLNYELIKL
tara:strand:- start:1149 stop:1964 length:816 start_codon:yes stop_codon:yes gene_type:complete